MTANDFGIYILTYPGDFHLSTVLVRSIQYVSPDIPIMIIPGEGFDLDDHPFDVPIMPIPGGFWGEIGHQDRDFWAFQGPFEKFLYLDADTICVKSLDSLARRIAEEEEDFIYIQTHVSEAEWLEAARDTTHPQHEASIAMVRNELGPGPLTRFDPDHDFFAHRPFNSGVFASRRLAISESELADLNRRERTFYKEALGIKEWNWQSSDLFFRDQGRLNYLIHHLAIPTYPLEPDLICIPGASSVRVSFADVKAKTPEFHIIHYMGAKSPTPSYFCDAPLFSVYAQLWSFVGLHTGRYVSPSYHELTECPAYSLWRHYYENEHGPTPFATRFRWSRPDLKKTAKLAERSLRLRIRKYHRNKLT